MKNILYLGTILISIAFTSSAFAQLSKCVDQKELLEIAGHFPQIEKLVDDPNLTCDSKSGLEWSKVINAIIFIRNFRPSTPAYDKDDVLTYKTIKKETWWEFLATRVADIVIEEPTTGLCRYEHDAFSLGRTASGDLKVFICPQFLNSSLPEIASILMSFASDLGESVATCRRGLSRVDDRDCLRKYNPNTKTAVRLEVLVALVRAESVDLKVKTELKKIIYDIVTNSFNIVPPLKFKNSIILSNDLGEVYKWEVGKKSISLQTVLDGPAKIYSLDGLASAFTIFPTDTRIDAYRTDHNFQKVENPGGYANAYNNSSPVKRAGFGGVSYFGWSGAVINNSLMSVCEKKEGYDIVTADISSSPNTIISLSIDEKDTERVSVLIRPNGDVKLLKCRDYRHNLTAAPVYLGSTFLKFTEQDSQEISNSFGLAGKQYALLKSGKLVSLSFEDSVYQARSLWSKPPNLPSYEKLIFQIEDLMVPALDQNWIGATPIKEFSLFSN